MDYKLLWDELKTRMINSPKMAEEARGFLPDTIIDSLNGFTEGTVEVMNELEAELAAMSAS
jgi:hypothetical protein